MNSYINIISAVLGLVLAGTYLFIVLCIHKSKPELTHIIAVILSGAGLVTGSFLGYISLCCSKEKLGELVDYRIHILIGSVAIIYISFESVVKLLKKPEIVTSQNSPY